MGGAFFTNLLHPDDFFRVIEHHPVATGVALGFLFSRSYPGFMSASGYPGLRSGRVRLRTSGRFGDVLDVVVLDVGKHLGEDTQLAIRVEPPALLGRLATMPPAKAHSPARAKSRIGDGKSN